MLYINVFQKSQYGDHKEAKTAKQGFYRTLEERTRFKLEKLPCKCESKADNMGQYTVLFFIFNTS